MYGKSTETAIAAISRLAEMWDGGQTRLAASDIADSRGLQRPFVSKVLSALAQGGIVTSTRGPGGGFALSRPPSEIRLHDVYRLFERENESSFCPFGGGICGVDDPCPIHDKLVGVKDAVDCVLNETTFEAFRKAYQDDGRRPIDPKSASEPEARPSYRAGSTRDGDDTD